MTNNLSDNKVRRGVGTIRLYIGRHGTTTIGIERALMSPGAWEPSPRLAEGTPRDGSTDFLTCEPALAADLVRRFGAEEDGRYTSMEGIIGLPCRYVESATGMLVKLDVLVN